MISLINKDTYLIVVGGDNCIDGYAPCTMYGSIDKRISVTVPRDCGGCDCGSVHIYCQGTDRGIYSEGRTMFCLENEMVTIEKEKKRGGCYYYKVKVQYV